MCVELDVFYVFQKKQQVQDVSTKYLNFQLQKLHQNKLPVETQSPMEYPMSSITVAKLKSK